MRQPVLKFLAGTFALSLASGSAAFYVGGEKTFESLRALPLLLLTIWSPNLVALWIRRRQGRLDELWSMLRQRGRPMSWLVALLPMLLVALLAHGEQVAPVSAGSIALLIAMNLAMGPLGEEVGWRGFLLPELSDRFGLRAASVGVGLVWAVWHFPLWLLPSPQSQIPIAVFTATVIAFSVIMTAAWQHGERALGPVIGFHLTANAGVGWLELSGIATAAESYEAGLPFYTFAALGAWLSMAKRPVAA